MIHFFNTKNNMNVADIIALSRTLTHEINTVERLNLVKAALLSFHARLAALRISELDDMDNHPLFIVETQGFEALEYGFDFDNGRLIRREDEQFVLARAEDNQFLQSEADELFDEDLLYEEDDNDPRITDCY